MEKFIGLDAHLSSCTFAVIGPNGKKLKTNVVETHGEALVEYIRSIRGTKRLCLEEGAMSQWLYELIEPHVAQIVVLVPPQSKGPKSDKSDAFALADKLRMNDLGTVVYKAQGRFRNLRELSKVYSKITTDVARVKNRLKSLYRSRGLSTQQQIYSKNGRNQWIEQLPLAVRSAAQHLYAEYDALTPIKKEAQQQMIHEAHRHPIARKLETTPGLGSVRVAQAMAIIVTPYRFRTKRQFWSYCGLGVVMRSSSDYVKQDGAWVRKQVQTTRGLNQRCNHELKAIFKGAATTVITQKNLSPLKVHYGHLLAGETKPNLAKLTIAREIAAIFLALWKNQEVYNPEYSQQKLS